MKPKQVKQTIEEKITLPLLCKWLLLAEVWRPGVKSVPSQHLDSCLRASMQCRSSAVLSMWCRCNAWTPAIEWSIFFWEIQIFTKFLWSVDGLQHLSMECRGYCRQKVLISIWLEHRSFSLHLQAFFKPGFHWLSAVLKQFQFLGVEEVI